MLDSSRAPPYISSYNIKCPGRRDSHVRRSTLPKEKSDEYTLSVARRHYANPNGTLGNANFGRITGILVQTERVIRFGGRFLF